MPFDPCYHQACDDIDNLDMEGAEDLGDGGAHVTATLAEDRNLRETLAGGLTAKSAKKAKALKKMSKARKARLAEYRGKKLVR